MIFHIHNPDGLPLLHMDGKPFEFTDGKKAATRAEHETRVTGIKHRAVRFFQEADWKKRERSRIESGEYLPLSWAKDAWWTAMEIPDHFAHVSKKNRSLIAYTESPEKGLADIQRACKPGTYLVAHFSDKLSPARIAELSAFHNATYDGSRFFITRDPDEIEHVYIHGPKSCMKKPLREFSSHIHPARLYGEPGDLGLAYVTLDGHITARSVVWPEKKYYSTIYGDHTKLSAFLAREGYTNNPLDGARLPKVPYVDPHGGDSTDLFIIPWIDGSRGAKIEDEWIVLVSEGGDLPCDTSCGVSQRTPPLICAHCNSVTSRHTILYVHTDAEARAPAETWCRTCADAHAFMCAGTNTLFAKSTVPVITPYRKNIYSHYYKSRNLRLCEKSGNYEEQCFLAEVCVGYHGSRRNIQRWSLAYCTPDIVFCDPSDGRWYINELRSAENPILCQRNYEKAMAAEADKRLRFTTEITPDGSLAFHTLP